MRDIEKEQSKKKVLTVLVEILECQLCYYGAVICIVFPFIFDL